MSPAKKQVEQDPLVAGLETVARRLDGLILLAIRGQTPPPTLAEQIRTLGDLGFDNSSIGRMVGKKTDYVATTRRRRSPGAKTAKKRGAARKRRAPKKG